MPTATAQPLAGALIVFDLDGTLVETAPDLIGALNVVLAEHGHPALPVDAARHLVGHGARALLTRGFADAGDPLDDARAHALSARFIEVYAGRLSRESRPYPGVPEALDALEADGARLAVCTNKPGGLSRALLADLGLLDRFVTVTGAEDAPARKPDPRHLHGCVAAAGGAGHVLMVGDSINDLAAARACGFPCVLVSFGYTDTPAAELGADRLIDAFHELPAAARALLSPGLSEGAAP